MKSSKPVFTTPSKQESQYGIYLGGLPLNCSEQDIIDHFSQYGLVKSALINRSKEGKSKGCGQVFYQKLTPVEYEVVLKKNHAIKSKEIEVKKYVEDSEEKKRQLNEDNRKSIHVNGLSGLSEDVLKHHFKQFGQIDRLYIIHRDDGTSRGFGFIKFQHPESAEKAVDFKRHIVQGKELNVTAKNTKNDEKKKKEPLKTNCSSYSVNGSHQSFYTGSHQSTQPSMSHQTVSSGSHINSSGPYKSSIERLGNPFHPQLNDQTKAGMAFNDSNSYGCGFMEPSFVPFSQNPQNCHPYDPNINHFYQQGQIHMQYTDGYKFSPWQQPNIQQTDRMELYYNQFMPPQNGQYVEYAPKTIHAPTKDNKLQREIKSSNTQDQFKVDQPKSNIPTCQVETKKKPIFNTNPEILATFAGTKKAKKVENSLEKLVMGIVDDSDD